MTQANLKRLQDKGLSEGRILDMENKKGSAYITYDSRVMSVVTPYNAKFVDELKTQTKSRRWNADKKSWTILLTERKKALEIIGYFFTLVEVNAPDQTAESNQMPVEPPLMIPLNITAGDEVEIWTDGACFANPGPGGYAAIIQNKGQKTEIVGGFSHTTNNRMEIMGAIAALETLKVKCKAKIYSDSQYLVNSISKGWAKNWKAKNWVRKNKKVPNWDLWDKLLILCKKLKVEFIWVKGHNLQAENERCNELAEAMARSTGLPIDTGYDELTNETALNI